MFQTIVFAYDGSAEHLDTLAEGIALATHFNAHCYLLAVVPFVHPLAIGAGAVPDDFPELERVRYGAILDEGVERLRIAGLDASGVLSMWIAPALFIPNFAEEVGADLIIIGHHKHLTYPHFLQESLDLSLLDLLPCSLFISMPREELSHSS